MVNHNVNKSEKHYNYDSFMWECDLFNIQASKVKVPTKQSLMEQLELIREELNETFYDLHQNDLTGVLDGYTDLMVTTAGLGQMLETLGMKTLDALAETAENNLSKIVDEADSEEIINTLDLYQKKDVAIVAERNLQYGVIVFKDMNNKVRKPAGFISNDVSKYIPEGLVLKEE